MPALHFATLLVQDAAGCWTALPIEPPDELAVGFASTAAQALDQLREYLTWLHQRDPERPAPDLRHAELKTFKVPVRAEYPAGNWVYACAEPLILPVHCVAGTLSSGLRVAALPLLNVRFYYHESDHVQNLVVRYTQQQLKGLTPRQLLAYLPPPRVQLEEIVVRARPRRRITVGDRVAGLTLAQVAEPLSERGVRRQFGPAWERGELVQAVMHRLHHERTNLLLVGPPGVGKTTVLVEAVQTIERRRAEAEKRTEHTAPHAPAFWATSAGRLIAGMKYLGQWEQRCEQIIEELARLPGVLCIDRLLDLLRLGGTGPGDSLAAFFLPYLRRGELRLIAEATPAEVDACRRLLPGFADLFPVVLLPPFSRAQALAILDRTAQRYAQDLKLTVEPGVTDRVYQLFRRFAPYQEVPGPVVRFIRDLCQEHRRQRRRGPVTSPDVVAQFLRRTGLPEWLLRDEVRMDRERLRDELHRQVLGQEAAVDAVVQLVTTFKAGLNDPQRPIGVLLFCGPTGVGKTELARALARQLFGNGDRDGRDDDRLLRLDMSEYAGVDAVSRLLGTGGEPGPVIRRVRQQPFCVVLLDEIEKAAPEVFDVLLSVCDEGRLTDRYGRTTTFRSTVVLMTSNLGADQRERMGLGRRESPSYSDVARSYFRPEFFNRLDAVVTFQPLTAATIQAITRKELAEIAHREGLERAGLRVVWSERLVERLAHEGFDTQYGARPLQRVLERRVVAPLARYLLAHPALCDVELYVDCTAAGDVVITHP